MTQRADYYVVLILGCKFNLKNDSFTSIIITELKTKKLTVYFINTFKT